MSTNNGTTSNRSRRGGNNPSRGRGQQTVDPLLQAENSAPQGGTSAETSNSNFRPSFPPRQSRTVSTANTSSLQGPLRGPSTTPTERRSRQTRHVGPYELPSNPNENTETTNALTGTRTQQSFIPIDATTFPASNTSGNPGNQNEDDFDGSGGFDNDEFDETAFRDDDVGGQDAGDGVEEGDFEPSWSENLNPSSPPITPSGNMPSRSPSPTQEQQRQIFQQQKGIVKNHFLWSRFLDPKSCNRILQRCLLAQPFLANEEFVEKFHYQSRQRRSGIQKGCLNHIQIEVRRWIVSTEGEAYLNANPDPYQVMSDGTLRPVLLSENESMADQLWSRLETKAYVMDFVQATNLDEGVDLAQLYEGNTDTPTRYGDRLIDFIINMAVTEAWCSVVCYVKSTQRFREENRPKKLAEVLSHFEPLTKIFANNGEPDYFPQPPTSNNTRQRGIRNTYTHHAPLRRRGLIRATGGNATPATITLQPINGTAATPASTSSASTSGTHQ